MPLLPRLCTGQTHLRTQRLALDGAAQFNTVSVMFTDAWDLHVLTVRGLGVQTLTPRW